MNWKQNALLFGSILLTFWGCQTAPKENLRHRMAEPDYQIPQNFGDYWYQGKAEVTSFKLTQSRYGAPRQGHAVQVFVTEDFDSKNQVKVEKPKSISDKRKVKVLKLNFVKKFTTGIYPYSLMTSSFSPVYPDKFHHALKLSFSSQEWCGNMYIQVNNRYKEYQMMMHSYFQDEADQNELKPVYWQEDELWNLIRLAPEKLPTDTITIYPSLEYLRLHHHEWEAHKAEAKLINTSDSLQTYTLHYPDLKRSLSITFDKAFPHRIDRWKEVIENGEKPLVTTAVRDQQIMLDYWNKHNPVDTTYRSLLHIPMGF